VVFPARIADCDLRRRIEALQEVRADLQRARAAQRLRRHDAAGGDQRRVVAEQQFLHRCVVDGDTFDRQIAARQRSFDACLFRFADGAQQRNLAFFVGVHADTQVDLGGARVGIEGFVQAQNRVTGSKFDGGEQRHDDSAVVKRGTTSDAARNRMRLEAARFGICGGSRARSRSRIRRQPRGANVPL
jgi:hypothetical protein